MKTFKMITGALIIVALMSSVSFAAKKDILCTQIGKKNDIIEKAPKKDLTYNMWPCVPELKAAAQSKNIK